MSTGASHGWATMLYVVGFALVWLPVVAVVLVARSRQSRRAWWRVRAWWAMRRDVRAADRMSED